MGLRLSVKYLESHCYAKHTAPDFWECSLRFRCFLRVRLASQYGGVGARGVEMGDILVCVNQTVSSPGLYQAHFSLPLISDLEKMPWLSVSTCMT